MAYSYKTAISFGLVYIPVTLHASVKNNDIGFNMLHKKYKSRIKYKKTCDLCGEEDVKQSDIIKGYEYDDDKYVTFTQEELDKLKTPKDKFITINNFSNLNEIDPIYYERSFYVAPTGADNAYFLIAKAMEDEKKVAIAKTVLGTKEYVVALRAIDGKLILSTLFFHDEVQKNPVKVPTTKFDKDQLTLAKQIIKNLDKTFKPEDYKDEYQERIEKAIEDKINGNEVSAVSQEKSPRKVINIMEALKRTLEETEGKKPSTKMKKAK